MPHRFQYKITILPAAVVVGAAAAVVVVGATAAVEVVGAAAAVVGAGAAVVSAAADGAGTGAAVEGDAAGEGAAGAGAGEGTEAVEGVVLPLQTWIRPTDASSAFLHSENLDKQVFFKAVMLW